MNNPLAPLCSAFGKLSIGGVSQTSTRLASTRKQWKQPRPDLTGFEPGWGEKIWVWTHMHTGMVVYSHREQMKANKAMAQIPFTAKKVKPAKLRRDYWYKLCMIDFGTGQEVVGRNVFQKLRELRNIRLVSWPVSLHRDPYTGNTRTKKQRGFAILDQHKNTVADVAAVLGGLGPSNKMVLSDKKGDGDPELRPATIYWDNDMDREFARKWTENVTHRYLSEIVKPPKKGKKDVPALPEPEPEPEKAAVPV